MSISASRREFLKRSTALSGLGAAAPWALTLSAMGDAAAQSAPTDYKALVCVFLLGGNDYANTIIPYDIGTANNGAYNAYLSVRGGLPAAGGLAITRDDVLASNLMRPKTALTGSASGMEFALNPYVVGTNAPTVNPLLDVFNNERLAVLFNVGTLRQPTTKEQYRTKTVPLPPKLFSHNDQQSLWQSSKAEGALNGWGGRLGDLFASANAQSTFTSVAVGGNAVFLSGMDTVQYQISNNGSIRINGVKNTLFGSSAAQEALRNILTTTSSNPLANEYASIANRSIVANDTLTSALTSYPGNYTAVLDTGNSLMQQLKMVARMVQAGPSLGVKRQVFFVSLGGFDNHDSLTTNHPVLQQKVSAAMTYFDTVLGEIGARNSVTAFTASDFGRTLTGNGNGSDHGWGSHHYIMGGAVKGKEFYGRPPVLTEKDSTGKYACATSTGGPDDVGQGRLLPSTSVDQMAATLARWFGVSDTDLATVLPQISNWSASQRNLGFMR
jgi:uncharacterized protein (DUF1501 family)